MTCFSGQDFYVELSQKMDELIFELATSFDKHPTFLPCLHWVTYIKTTGRYSATPMNESCPLHFPSHLSIITTILQTSLLAAKEGMLGNSLSTSILLLLLLFSPSQVQLRKLRDSKYSQLILRKQSYEQLFVPVFFTTIYLLSFLA